MRKLTTIILLLCALVVGAQADIVTADLLHRWTFTETASPYVDSVAGAALRNTTGRPVSVAAQTGGRVTGVKFGNAAGTDSLGTLLCDAADMDLTGRQKLTVEIIYSCYMTDGPAVWPNIISITADSSAANPVGLQLKKARADQKRAHAFLRDSGGGIGGAGYVDLASDRYVGSLTKCTFVNDSIGGTSAVYFASLDDATVGSAKYTSTGDIDELDGYNLLLGDPARYVGELHVVEVRIYGAALSSTQINTNHTQDILQYGTTTPIDVWLDASASSEGYGTITSPYKTIEAAWKRATRGTTLHFAKGTYEGAQYVKQVSTTYTSTLRDITLLGLASDPDGVIIEAGATDTDYPLQVTGGTFYLRYLKFDADSTTAYCVYADDSLTSLNLDVCELTNTLAGASKGTGIMSRAMQTVVDSCRFYDIEEHGVYLRNLNAQHDYGNDAKAAGVSSVTNCTFTDWNNYAVQVSNEADTTYCFNSLVIAHNTASNPKSAGSGGFHIAGTDTAYVRHNVIDLSSVTSTGYGISFGSGARTNAEDGWVYNNEITGALVGIYSASDTDADYYSHGMGIYNNYLMDCTTDASLGTAVGYKLRANKSIGSATSFADTWPDSAGVQEVAITAQTRNWAGYGPLDGLFATEGGFFRFGVVSQASLTADAANTRNDPDVTTAQPGFESWVGALATLRGWGMTGKTLDGGSRAADQMNLGVYLHAPHPAGGGSWAEVAGDSLRVGTIR